MSSFTTEIRSQREQMLLRMIWRMFRAMNDDTIARTIDRGHRELQASYTRLLGNLDTDGTRIASLARRMGTSRQAASQAVQEIEEQGLIERTPDPDDKRGVIVRFTPKGRRTLQSAIDSMLEIEAEYAALLGEGSYKKLKQLLGQLLEHVDPQGALGLD